MIRLLRIPALAYLGFAAMFLLLQARIIFPGHATQGRPEAQVRPRPGTELVRLEAHPGTPVVALYGPALSPQGRPLPDAANRPTLLFFYGNAMCLRDSQYEHERFRRLGINVLIPEYVGYGMSGGSPSELGCRETALAAWDYLVKTRGAAPGSIVVGGWSLGGAVAVDLATRRPAAGLIMLSSFTSAVDMARRIVPFLPASLLLRHRFESLDKIKRIQSPALIGHGRRDGIIPFSMAERLAAAAGGPVTTLWIDDADHNDFLDIAGERLDRAIERFVASLPPAPPAHSRSEP